MTDDKVIRGVGHFLLIPVCEADGWYAAVFITWHEGRLFTRHRLFNSFDLPEEFESCGGLLGWTDQLLEELGEDLPAHVTNPNSFKSIALDYQAKHSPVI